jgi:glycosyltransferase involved in cell wall biosynthesis
MMLLPRALRPAYGVFIHDTDGWGETMPARRERTFRKATLRLANSRFTAGRTEAAHPEIGPVVPCPLGLLPIPAGAPTPPLDAPRRRDVLILGRLSSATRYKGHDLLIESWADICRAAPDARLLVAGDGDDAPRLRELARKHRVSDRVVFLGFVSEEELERILHEIAVLAMPSTGEGFGLAYLRAMRAAAPCVALSAGVTPEVIVHGESGLLSHPGDRRGLIDSIVTLLTDDVLRRMLGRGARARYDAHFTFERFTRRLEGAIEPLIERALERR